MTVVSAFLCPGSPLPYVRRDNPPWTTLAAAMERARDALSASEPDTVVIYSTQWFAVLDQLWLTRPHCEGIHVDENWHEYGTLAFSFDIDLTLASAIIESTPSIGIRSKGVDYDEFPVDTGTIVAKNLLNPEGSFEFVVASNNLYHDWDTTAALGRLVAENASKIGRRVAIVGVGGLSGKVFREPIDITKDRIVSEQDDIWNRRVLKLMEAGEYTELMNLCPEFVEAASVDMGFKHFSFLMGATGGFTGATVHGYGPLYGAGGAVVEFTL